MARRVNDVDALLDSLKNFVNAGLLSLRPCASCRRGCNRDAAFAFLLHPVGHGRPFVHLTDLVNHARIKQDALGQRRLAGIDVRRDPDVPGPLERELAIGRIRILRDTFLFERSRHGFTSGNAQTRGSLAPFYVCLRAS